MSGNFDIRCGTRDLSVRAAVLALALAVISLFAASATRAQGSSPEEAMRKFLSPADIPVIARRELATLSVKPGLFMIIGAGGNTTVRATSAGLLLCDVKNPDPAVFQDLLKQVQAISNAPIRYAVVSHDHGDHSGNLGRFEERGVVGIVQKNYLHHIDGPHPPGMAAPDKPSETYDLERTLQLGSAVIKLYHFGQGHTDDDTIAYFPDLKVVSTGDLYVSITPFVAYFSGGSLLGTRDAIARLLKLDFTTAIPGHGFEPVPRANIEKYLKDLDRVIAAGRAAVKAGAPAEQVFASPSIADLTFVSTPQWKTQLQAFHDELATHP